jgi:TolB-like protein
MKHVQLLCLIVTYLALTACAFNSASTADSGNQDNLNLIADATSGDAPFSFNPIRSSASALHNLPAPSRNINFYVRGIMQDLISNLQFVNETTPVAVTSFVMLNSNYQEAGLLGNQIAESLIHEIHKFGIPVIDFKTVPEIRINEQGDYIFSRDPENLNKELPVHYVFSGTLVKHQGGYLVNARVVGLNSKAVVASAQSFIPSEVSNALIDEGRAQTKKAKKSISLVQGS